MAKVFVSKTLRMPPFLADGLALLAKETGTSQESILAAALQKYLLGCGYKLVNEKFVKESEDQQVTPDLAVCQEEV